MRRRFPRRFSHAVLPALLLVSGEAGPSVHGDSEVLRCANLVYAGEKSSVCFSDKFLTTLQYETNMNVEKAFHPVKLSGEEIYDHPFAVMTGEGSFVLFEEERKNLKSYLTRGGFLLASAGCSSVDWDRSFRAEIGRAFPDLELKRLPKDHPLFTTVFEVGSIRLKSGGEGWLEGLEIDGKIVLVYSSEGLNDTPNVKGCCCCGGNEVKNCQELNVNIFTYSITH